MSISRVQLNKYRFFIFIVTLSSLLGAFFSGLMVVSNGFPVFYDSGSYIVLGLLSGFGISSVILVFDSVINRYKPLPVWTAFIIVPVVQTFIIGTIYSVVYILVLGMEEYIKNSYIAPTLGFSLLSTVVFNFFHTVNRLLGQNVLKGLFLGTYHSPRSESRFVMFLDIAGSTTIAEKLGALAFHRFLNDFFCDISAPVINCRGDIYKYVGDEIIITWKENIGKKQLNALRVFFEIKNTLGINSDKYLERYGLVPEFRAGLHFGNTVAGEIGLHKQEIAFSGDVLNTAARIQAQCRILERSFLVSDEVLSVIDRQLIEDSGYSVSTCGSFPLRGKAQETGINAISRQ